MKQGSTQCWLTIPNVLTSSRIVGSVVLLFLPPLSPWFYGVYTFAGISDALDGFVARATHAQTELGARLDSVADLLFYAAMILRLFPLLYDALPRVIWPIVAVVLALRLASYMVAAFKYKCFASVHTWMNKVTGAVVFMTPYFMKTPFLVPYCFAVCVIGGLASAEEMLIHLTSTSYDPRRKSLFFRSKAE